MMRKRVLFITLIGMGALGLFLWWNCNAILPLIAGGRFTSAVQQQVAAESPIAGSFLRRFPNAKVYLSDYSASASRLQWNGIAGLHSRYILIMTVDVRLGRGMSRTVGEPHILVLEVESVRDRGGGALSVGYQGQHICSASEWQAFVDSGGDLRACGIEDVKTDQPVLRFEEALQRH